MFEKPEQRPEDEATDGAPDAASPEAAGDESAAGARASRPTGEPGEPGETERPGEPESLDDLGELRRKAAERDEYLDLLKRTRADFANYRKRVDEERARWGRDAQRELLARLLSAADQCRLAAEKSKDDDSAESLRGCIGLIWSEVERFFASSGVTTVPTEGESFDPERHEAVFVQERDDVPDGAIVDEVRAGYRFGDQVIRPAQVVVAKRPKPAEPPEPPEPESNRR